MESKLLIFSPGPSSGGGIHSVVSDHASFFKKNNVPHQIVHTSGKHFFYKVLNILVCILVIIRHALIKKEIICIFHVASGNSFYRKYLLIFIAKKLLKSNYILHLHGGRFKEFYENSNPFTKESISKTFSEASVVVVLSKSWKIWLETKIPKANVTIIPNSIDAGDVHDYISISGICKNIDILFVGRVEEKKGIDDFLHAIKSDFFKDLKICFVGKLTDDYISFKFPHNVQILGQVPRAEVSCLMQQAKVLVLPSHFEAFPVVILEAMINGAICVCSNVGSIPEIINNEVNGYIFPAKNINELRKALQKALDPSDSNEIIRSTAFYTVKNYYQSTENISKLLKVYSSFLVHS